MMNKNHLLEILSQVPQDLHNTVLNYWADWQLACKKSLLHTQVDLDIAQLGKIWACSDFAAQICIRHPDTLLLLLRDGIESNRSLTDYRKIVAAVLASATLKRTAQVDDEVMQALRQLRQREMLRISWRDLSQCTDPAQILYELSDLAEAVVTQTLRFIEMESAKIFGQPQDSKGRLQALLVLAMGKMGGRELNFSSDIDLIFAYVEEGETPGPRRTSHHEYFLWVAKRLIRYLNEITKDGFVYRVDTRLRPNGASGPLVISFAGMEQYYQLQGRNWERYALIKARIISGDSEHRQALQTLLTPFVFRRYLDYGAFESIREMKAMIVAQVKRKGMQTNIKLGQGGIREIEFIGQTFQLLRGGREPELRVRSIVAVLSLLTEKKYLSQAESTRLIEAYWFLRRLENRLQMQRDQQTHSLPDDALAQSRLCLAMDMADWTRLLQQLDYQRNFVAQIFTQLIAPADVIADVNAETNIENAASTLVQATDETAVLSIFWEEPENTEPVSDWLSQAGYKDAECIVKQLLQFQQSARVKRMSADSQRRLILLLSALLKDAAAYQNAEKPFGRVLNILNSIAGRAVYISILNEYPKLRTQLLKLCAAGDWFAETIAQFPLLLDSLLNVDELLMLEPDIDAQLQHQLKQIGQEHTANLLEEQMERLRQFKRQRVFKLAMLDVFYALPVETVADELTATADAILKQILQQAWQAMVARYGEPECIENGQRYRPVLSIIGYGKLGGYELGYGSDVDIIFLHDSRGEEQHTSGSKSIDNSSFFIRVAQRLIHMLHMQTYSGLLYEVDTRLRPDGQGGLMVSSLQAFDRYQHEKAWIWEHQALIRARFISGNAHVEQEFDRIRRSVLLQSRKPADVLFDVVKMREKMRTHLANKSQVFDIKQDAGGLIDIEFMTQAGVLVLAQQHSDCIKHTGTLALIKELAHAGWYLPQEAVMLSAAYRYFRKLKNRQSLKCEINDSEVPVYREKVISLWQRLIPDVDRPVKGKPAKGGLVVEKPAVEKS